VTLPDAKVHLNIPDSSLNAPAMHISPTGYPSKVPKLTTVKLSLINPRK
jgi:hypothetical protein